MFWAKKQEANTQPSNYWWTSGLRKSFSWLPFHVRSLGNKKEKGRRKTQKRIIKSVYSLINKCNFNSVFIKLPTLLTDVSIWSLYKSMYLLIRGWGEGGGMVWRAWWLKKNPSLFNFLQCLKLSLRTFSHWARFTRMFTKRQCIRVSQCRKWCALWNWEINHKLVVSERYYRERKIWFKWCCVFFKDGWLWQRQGKVPEWDREGVWGRVDRRISWCGSFW